MISTVTIQLKRAKVNVGGSSTPLPKDNPPKDDRLKHDPPKNDSPEKLSADVLQVR